MKVKQVSLDVVVKDSTVDLESIIKDLLIERGFSVLGTSQTDMSEEYSDGKYTV